MAMDGHGWQWMGMAVGTREASCHTHSMARSSASGIEMLLVSEVGSTTQFASSITSWKPLGMIWASSLNP